jgi:hypothetical protein
MHGRPGEFGLGYEEKRDFGEFSGEFFFLKLVTVTGDDRDGKRRWRGCAALQTDRMSGSRTLDWLLRTQQAKAAERFARANRGGSGLPAREALPLLQRDHHATLSLRNPDGRADRQLSGPQPGGDSDIDLIQPS